MKAAGAVPGRVGRCPSCGQLLRVPDATRKAQVEPPHPPNQGESHKHSDQDASSAFVAKTKPRRSKKSGPQSSKNWDGFLPVPSQPEKRIRASILYPLWGTTGIALLVFGPPLLWFTSLPFLSLGGPSIRDDRGRLTMLFSLLPATLMLAPIASFILLLFGRVLTTSAVGEVHHPRWPEWEFSEMARGLSRWAAALVIGGFLGFTPAIAYWIYCGDIDAIDAVVLLELLAIGVVYGQTGLLASILHDDYLGANPVTVIRALIRLKGKSFTPAVCVIAGGVMIAGAWKGVFLLGDPALMAFGYWLFWVFALYAMMVVLRILGLFYHRNARVLGWFRDRPGWGA